MFGFITHAVAGLTLIAFGSSGIGLCMIAGGTVWLMTSGDDDEE